MQHAFYENKQGQLLASNQSNLQFPPHLHWMLELVLVLQGELTVTIGNTSQRLQAGDAGLVFPHVIHAYDTERESVSTLYLCHPLIAGAVAHTLTRERPVQVFFRADAMSARLRDDLRELTQLAEGEGSTLRRALFQLALVRLLEHTTLLPADETADETLLERAVRYITQHFREPVSLEILARTLHVNPFFMSKTFSAAMGMGLPAYVNSLRVEYAKELLHTTDLPITEIALESGFENLRSFNRNFHNITTQTPRAFRQGKGGHGEGERL